jgi:hypothetical protein
MQSENMQLLIPPDIPKRRERDRDKEDDLSLLEQITGVNPAAGKRFLEYLVVTRRSPVCDHQLFICCCKAELMSLQSPELHTRLALLCIDELLQCLEDEAIMKLWRAKGTHKQIQPLDRCSTVKHSFVIRITSTTFISSSLFT